MNRNSVRRILFVLVFLAVAFALVYFAFRETVPDLLPLLKHGDVDEIQAYLRSSGTWKGVLCTALLQMLQVFSLVISGVPIQVAAGVVYGSFYAMLICLLASSVAQMLAFLLWTRMGKRMAQWFPVEGKQLRVIQRLRDSGTPPRYTVFLAGMIPVLPNGLIPLLATKMEITVWDFALWVGLGSLPNIFLCCAIGNRLIRGDWLLSIVYFVVMLSIVIVMWKFQDRVLGLYRRIVRPKNKDEDGG
ncbi:MAG: TVP38/TMEM64 family protein [Oscillospiraceae bacterium]|nr:TVP38/TMEM64 family protein [Oscillospiraceae bacterium]